MLLTFKNKGETTMSKSTESALAVQQVESQDQLQQEMARDYQEMEQRAQFDYKQQIINEMFGVKS
jgi:hypothetical protein|tara:strand:+ start:2013 stop:2207 length:195 start_codon:yes stop_codon:yes gene_type:complete